MGKVKVFAVILGIAGVVYQFPMGKVKFRKVPS